MKKPSDATWYVLKKSKKYIFWKIIISIIYRGIIMITPIIFGAAVDMATAGKYRDAILTSGINDVILTNKIDTSFVTKSQLLCSTIEALKNNAYDNRIPVMALHYFFEMYTVFSDVRRLLTDNAVILLVLGDSIFNNIHIKTDKILIELFQEMGYIFEKEILLRERKSRNGGTLSQVLLKFKYHKNEQ